MMIMRPPQQGHGRGSTRGSSTAVASDVSGCSDRLASTRDAVSGHLIGLHLGDQEYTVALTGNHVTD